MPLITPLKNGLPAALSALTSGSLASAVKGAEENLPQPVRDVLANRFLGIHLWQYITACALVLCGLVLRRVVIYILDRSIKAASVAILRMGGQVVQTITQPIAFAVLMLGVLGAEKILFLPVALDRFATNLAVSILIVDAAWLLVNLADMFATHIGRAAERTEARLDQQLIPIIRKSAKVFIIIIAALQVIEQMGGDVKSLLTGLGLGGLAFALAARESIANLFGSVVILADRPFRVGDWIEAHGQGIEGIVEEIGIRSTRIRTFNKTLITVPNSVVANWAVNNWSAMPKRRVKMTVHLAPQTAPGLIESALAKIREFLNRHSTIDQTEPRLAYFNDFGENALSLLVDYFTTTTDYAQYLAVREEVNLALTRIFEELGIKFAIVAPPAVIVQAERSRASGT